MTLSFKCWASNPTSWPCDLDVTADPVVGVAAAFAMALATIGFFALIYLLAKGRAT